jgi:hypothetical protein
MMSEKQFVRAAPWLFGIGFFVVWEAAVWLFAIPQFFLPPPSVIAQFVAIVALLHLFPSGRPLGPRHARVFTAFVVAFAGLALLLVFAPGPMGLTGTDNPVGFLPGWARAIWEQSFVLVGIFALVGIGALVVRWRRSGLAERAQLRWFLAASVVAFAGIASLNAIPGLEVVGFIVAVTAFWSLPAAIVVAVTRYRLYEIDRLVSRTVSYAVLAGLLPAVYASIVIGLPQVLPVTLDSSLLVAGATLIAAALFNPVRRWVQRVVDRRFNRVRYDAQREMDRLAARLRTELDLGELTGEVLAAVTTTMQPTDAGVWIRARPAARREFRNDAGTVRR